MKHMRMRYKMMIYSASKKSKTSYLFFLSNVSLKDHQCTESLLEKSKMLSVKRINAQTKITEVWKAINKDNKDNSFKASLPNNNQEERVSRSKTNGLLNISGSSNGARNSFINDSKMVWNNCPVEITKYKALHPPKSLIKKFLSSLPLPENTMQSILHILYKQAMMALQEMAVLNGLKRLRKLWVN